MVYCDESDSSYVMWLTQAIMWVEAVLCDEAVKQFVTNIKRDEQLEQTISESPPLLLIFDFLVIIFLQALHQFPHSLNNLL